MASELGLNVIQIYTLSQIFFKKVIEFTPPTESSLVCHNSSQCTLAQSMGSDTNRSETTGRFTHLLLAEKGFFSPPPIAVLIMPQANGSQQCKWGGKCCTQ